MAEHDTLFMTQTPKEKFLEEVSDLMRVRHMSLATERHYLHWMRRFILFHGKVHPRTLGKDAIAKFLTYLAVERDVAPATQNQALNALVFMYRELLMYRGYFYLCTEVSFSFLVSESQ